MNPEYGCPETSRVIQAHPSTYKAYWPEVRGSYFFRSRRVYLDYLNHQGGRIYHLPSPGNPSPPFILIGNWRDRPEITAIWHIKAGGAEREELILGTAERCFDEGVQMMITKLLVESEAAEFEGWGFEEACRIILLEKPLYREPPEPPYGAGVSVATYRRRNLDRVLEVDAMAFDDFWRLDARTIEAISTSCQHNLFLLAKAEGEIIGYALGGINGRIGYLQRLAVDPRHQGRGVGRCLALSILDYFHRLGGHTAIVNTQEYNHTALSLYRSLGFLQRPGIKSIMCCANPGTAGAAR